MKNKLIRLLLGIWATGIGLKFIIGYIQGNIYEYRFFDIVFDWGILFILGIINILAVIINYYMEKNKMENILDNETKEVIKFIETYET